MYSNSRQEVQQTDIRVSVAMLTDIVLGPNLRRHSFPAYDLWEALLVFTKRRKETSKHNCAFVTAPSGRPSQLHKAFIVERSEDTLCV